MASLPPPIQDNPGPPPPGGRTIAWNTLLLSATEFSTRLVSLALIILVARRLGPALLGIYAFALGLVRVAELVLNFGLDRYLQREVGRRPEAAAPLCRRVLALKSLLYLGCLGVLLPVVFLMAEPLKRQVVALLLAALFFRSHTASLTALFRGRQLAGVEARVVITMRLLYGGGGVAAVLAGYGLVALALLEVGAQAAALGVALWLFYRRIGSPWGALSWSSLRELAAAGKQFFLIRLVLTLSASLHLLLLSVLAGDLATGFYAAALRLTSAFDFLPEAFTGAFLPALSREGPGRQAGFLTIFQNYLKYLVLVGLGLGACLAATGPVLVPLMFGPRFKSAVPVLSLLSVALALEFLNLALSTSLIALDAEGRVLRIFSRVLVATVAANLLLVPLLREQGAAWAAVAAEGVALALQLRALKRQGFKPGQDLARLWRPLTAALAALVGGRLLLLTPAPWVLVLASPPLIFLVGLMITGAIGRAEFHTLRAWAGEGRHAS